MGTQAKPHASSGLLVTREDRSAVVPPNAVERTHGAEAGHARGPNRTCVGCRHSRDLETLLRVVLGPGGVLIPDLARRAPGRGAWVHLNSECLVRATPKGFARSFRTEIASSAAELIISLRELAARRVESLLSVALRGRKLEVGSLRARDACGAGLARGIIVAADAGAALDSPWVLDVIASGQAMAWGTKTSLGRIMGTTEVALLAVTDTGCFEALSRAVQMSHYPLPAGKSGAHGPQGGRGNESPNSRGVTTPENLDPMGAPRVRSVTVTGDGFYGAFGFAPNAFPLSGLESPSGSIAPQAGGSTEV